MFNDARNNKKKILKTFDMYAVVQKYPQGTFEWARTCIKRRTIFKFSVPDDEDSLKKELPCYDSEVLRVRCAWSISEGTVFCFWNWWFTPVKNLKNILWVTKWELSGMYDEHCRECTMFGLWSSSNASPRCRSLRCDSSLCTSVGYLLPNCPILSQIKHSLIPW